MRGGVEQVGRAGDALHSIVGSVANISTLVANMASGSAEQANGLAEINIGVTQLDQVTQQNAAMVEEATAASHSLDRDASDLAGYVAAFRLAPDAEVQPQVTAKAARSAKQAVEVSWDAPPVTPMQNLNGHAQAAWQDF